MLKKHLFTLFILLNIIFLVSAGNIIVQDGHLESTGISNNYFKGEVGIGTDNPEIRLHLNGTDGADKGIALQKNEGDRLYIYLGGTGSDGYFKLDTYKPTAPDAERRLSIVLQPDGGNVGIGTTTQRTTLVSVSGLTNVVKIDVDKGNALSNGHVCVITSDKKVKCWGYTGYRQIGIGTTSPGRVSIPNLVYNLNNY